MPVPHRRAAAAPPLASLPFDPRLPLELLERLFDTLPDVVFFAKDREARYTHGNRTLLERLRLTSRAQLIGRRADELFPGPLGLRFRAQDEQVLREGRDIVDQLELHLFPSRSPGWCLTHKLPWRDPVADGGRAPVIGLVGLSRDLPSVGLGHVAPARTYAGVAAVVERLQRDFDQPLVLSELAAGAGLSMAQLERHVRHLYRLSPRQLLARTRLEAALRRLAEGDESIAQIAHGCGYADHSAFTRQFRRSTGLDPRTYRRLARE